MYKNEDKITRKYLEWCLYNYKINKVELKILNRNLKEELEAAKEISGINYNQEKVSETNETSDPTGEYLKRKEQIKKRYKNRIKRKEKHIELVEIAISLMTEREKKLITRKYIDGRQWVDIGLDEDINLTPRTCIRIRTKAIEMVLNSLNKEKEEYKENVL